MKKFASKLVYYPDKSLLSRCSNIDFAKTDINKLNKVIDEMKMEIINVQGFYKNNCIGISANQLGYNYNMFLVSKYPKSEREKLKYFDVFINTEILEESENQVLKWEGCISDTENLLLIKRPELIKIKYQNLKGQVEIRELSPIKSRICQHEIDHIKGIDLYKRNIVDKVRIRELQTDEMYMQSWIEKELEKQYLV